MNSEQKPCEKGNVARIVDRLSKDYGSGLGNSTIVSTKSENVPLRNRALNTSTSGFGLPFHSTETAVVRFSYAAQQPDELDLKEGDELAVLAHTEDGWARGEIINSPNNPGRKGLVGLYPTNFVSTSSATPSKQIPPVLSSPSSTFPRSVDSSHDKSHQENSHSTLISGVSAHQLSSSAPKPTVIGGAGNNFSSLGNGATTVTSSPGVLHTGNVLPSSLLRGGTVGSRTGEMCARRVTSTLMTENASNSHSFAPSADKDMAKVLYKYDAAAPDELSLPEGTLVTVINRQCEDEGWFIAEAPDGRRGLFPDNFVKFLPSESAINIQSSQISHQPPSLPAKPQKFNASTHGHSQPVAFVRDSLFGGINDSTTKQPNMSSEAKTPTDSGTDKLMTTSAISLSNDAENNNISPTNAATQNIISSSNNTPGNRHSMIAGMQKILFPGGKLPLQQPGSQRNSTIISGGKLAEASANVEPKMTDFDNNIGGGGGINKQQNNKLLASSSIVTARTKIVPSNKRPPSKVNSAALLAENTRDSFDNNNDTKILEMSSPTFTSTSKTTQSSNSSPTTATGGINNIKTSSVFSANPGEETSQSQHRYVPLGERISFQPPKTTLITSHVPSISLNTTTTTKDPLSSSLESQTPSTSQWVSRADFDRFAEECNRRFSEMHAELIDLRRRVDQNK
uniref:SH3 domain-containing protein n=1 Tax=Meloidogyne incognita TaxID=6306 RepID=A0A914MC04_MELIC